MPNDAMTDEKWKNREVPTPLKTIRLACLECTGENNRDVKWCPCDGHNSIWCPNWPYRFGKRPQSVKDQRLVTPERMPPADRGTPHNHTIYTDAELCERCQPPGTGKPFRRIGQPFVPVITTEPRTVRFRVG